MELFLARNNDKFKHRIRTKIRITTRSSIVSFFLLFLLFVFILLPGVSSYAQPPSNQASLASLSNLLRDISFSSCYSLFEDQLPDLGASSLFSSHQYSSKQVFQIHLPLSICYQSQTRGLGSNVYNPSSNQFDENNNDNSDNNNNLPSTQIPSYFSTTQPFAQLQLALNPVSEMGLSADSHQLIDLYSAYLGISVDDRFYSRAGFISSSFFDSKLLSYNQPLFSYSLGYFTDQWKAELLFSNIPYTKKDLPVISSDSPYVVSTLFSFSPSNYFARFVERVKAYAIFANNIPTELADQYVQKGNSVNRGEFYSELKYRQTTVGGSVDVYYDFSEKSSFSAGFEAAANPNAPKEKAIAMLGEVFYHRNYSRINQSADSNASSTSSVVSTLHFRSSVGYRIYSIGSDAYLAEFSDQYLGHTAIEGHQFVVGFLYDRVELELSYIHYNPKHPSPYKYKTNSVMFTMRLTGLK